MLQSVRHHYVLDLIELFSYQGAYYAVFPRPAVLLGRIVASPPYPTCGQLIAILGQVFLYRAKEFHAEFLRSPTA